MPSKRLAKSTLGVQLPCKKASVRSELDILIDSAQNLRASKGGWSIQPALQHLRNVDSRFEEVICKYGIPEALTSPAAVPKSPTSAQDDPFTSLFKIIVYQQLAGKAAEKIYAKVTSALNIPTDGIVPPEVVTSAEINVSNENGKKKILVNGVQSGLSESKAKFVKSLAEHFTDESKLKSVDFEEIDDTLLYEKLTAVNGLGPWSVHMFMIFSLQRPNVLPLGDLGVRKGVAEFMMLPK